MDSSVWQVKDRVLVFRSPWVSVIKSLVAPSDTSEIEYYSINLQRGALALVRDDAWRMLLIHRHRFVIDEVGWEIPGGIVEPGEEPIIAAAREVEEETGWRPVNLRPLCSFQPMPSRLMCQHDIFFSTEARYMSGPSTPEESCAIAWKPLDECIELVKRGQVLGSASVIAILYAALIARGDHVDD